MAEKQSPFAELDNLVKLAEFYDGLVNKGGLPSLVDHWRRIAANTREQLERRRSQLREQLLTAGTPK
jgi:hypothetical protein